jgi:hypothetical protein
LRFYGEVRMQESMSSEFMYPMARPVRWLVLVVSVLVAASAAVGAVLAACLPLVVAGEQPRWAMFGFEVVCLVAAVLGVLTSLGKFEAGPGLALACVAGTILVASVLGWQAAGRQMGGVALWPVLGARVAATVVLAIAGAWAVLTRRPGAVATAMRGALLIAPVAVGALAIVHPAGRRMVGSVLGASPAVEFLAVSIGFLIATVLLAAGGHLIVRAFEMGRAPGPSTSSPPTAGA